jgi:thioredoxin
MSLLPKEDTMSVRTTSDATFETDVLQSARPMLVDFTAEWCPPCKMIAPVLAQIDTDFGEQLDVVELDVDQNPEITRRYTVMSMPTLALFVDGEIVMQMVGARPRTAIVNAIEPHLAAHV